MFHQFLDLYVIRKFWARKEQYKVVFDCLKFVCWDVAIGILAVVILHEGILE